MLRSRYFWLETVVFAADVAVSCPFIFVVFAGLLPERKLFVLRKATERRLVEFELAIVPTLEMAC